MVSDVFEMMDISENSNYGEFDLLKSNALGKVGIGLYTVLIQEQVRQSIKHLYTNMLR